MAEQTEQDEKRDEPKDEEREQSKDEEREQDGGQENEEGGDEKPDYAAKAEKADNEMKDFEKQDDLPSNLKDWPDGKAKYVTFDSEGDEPYGDGLTEKLGPPVTHHEDGSVTVEGKGKVDNPEDYKGEPIPLALEAEDSDFEVSGDKNNPKKDSEQSDGEGEKSDGSRSESEESRPESNG